MLEGKALIEDTDMPLKMQIQAMACASQALDLYDVLDCKSIAAHIKKVTDGTNSFTVSISVSLNFEVFSSDLRPLFTIIGRNLTKDMGMDGSVWWDLTLGAFSLTLKGVSYISHWRLSTFSSSKVLFLLDKIAS
ncbi:UNVERIFIED_CONTAM: hypothetical protein Scaly_1864000 [Sesamum calycinum]|uniref:Dynein light chain n=2 Tax=Sesamum TaxID=4181 RepID=A0AAW2NEQ3_9LAMI